MLILGYNLDFITNFAFIFRKVMIRDFKNKHVYAH